MRAIDRTLNTSGLGMAEHNHMLGDVAANSQRARTRRVVLRGDRHRLSGQRSPDVGGAGHARSRPRRTRSHYGSLCTHRYGAHRLPHCTRTRWIHAGGVTRSPGDHSRRAPLDFHLGAPFCCSSCKISGRRPSSVTTAAASAAEYHRVVRWLASGQFFNCLLTAKGKT